MASATTAVRKSHRKATQTVELGLGAGGAVVAVYSGLDIDRAGLSVPSGVAVYDQALFIADGGNCRVIQCSYDFGVLTVDGWYGASTVSPGRFNLPVGSEDPLPYAGSGDLEFGSPWQVAVAYEPVLARLLLAVTDGTYPRTMLIDLVSQGMFGWIGADSDGGTGWHDPAPTGGALPVAGDGDGAFRLPCGVAFGPYGLVVSDVVACNLEFYRPESVPSPGVFAFASRFGGPGAVPGTFHAPTGLLTDREATLWVCDTNNSRLQRLAPPHPDSYSVLPPESGNVVIGGDVPLSSAALQIDSCTGGLLMPRYDLDTLYDGIIADPVEGLLVYAYGYSGGYKAYGDSGFYYWDGGAWRRLGELDYNEVQSYHIDYSAVQSHHIASGAIQSYHIPDNSIPDTKLQVLATAGKVAGSAVQLRPGGGLSADSSGLGVDAAQPNVVYVSAGAKGTSIQAALDSITDASATNPYLIRVGPASTPRRSRSSPTSTSRAAASARPSSSPMAATT